MLHSQLKSLEIEWNTKESAHYFFASGAVLLMLGFSASLVISSPALVVACFFTCTLGVAIYLSTDAYSQYKEKQLLLDQAKTDEINHDIVLQEYQIARRDFIVTMVKNAVIPSLLITMFAIYWPAAVVLTALYAGYELYHAYTQHCDKQAVNVLALQLTEPEAKSEFVMPLATN
jgi:hypothetical protein